MPEEEEDEEPEDQEEVEEGDSYEESEEDHKQQAEEEAGQKRAAASQPAEAPPAKQPKPESKQSDVSFSLIHNPEQDESTLPLGSLQKPYLRTSASISVMHLKKYLVSKFGADNLMPAQIMLTCKGEACGNTMQVGEISENIWKDDTKDLEFVYYSSELSK